VVVPRLGNNYKIWMTVLSLDDYKKKYPLVDEFIFTDQIGEYFKTQQPETVYLNKGVNGDSGLTTMTPDESHYNEICRASTDTTTMHNILCESRVFKNDEELHVMRWASLITCEAHVSVLQNVKPG